MVTGHATVHVRPVVDREEVEELLHVQELLLELTDDTEQVRVLEIGRKRLPASDDDGANWGYVRVAGDRARADQLLGEDTYVTDAQGERHQSSTRQVATGSWSLERSGSDTELAFELEIDRDDALVEQLRLAPRRSFTITVKNPRAGGDAGLDEEERPELPDELQERFDGNRWAPCDPIDFLDHENVEFVLTPS